MLHAFQVMRQQNLVESASTMIHMYELLLAHGSNINVKNSYGIPVPLQVGCLCYT